MPEETNHLHPTLSPTLINDPSTATSGIIANEVLHEQISIKSDGGNNYGTFIDSELVDEQDEQENDPNNGYAVSNSELYVIVLSLVMGVFLSSLDGTVVTTLLSTISSDLNALPRISWIATSYLLSCSAFQPLFGKISDIFGRKLLLVMCDLCFLVGCIICGMSNSLVPLIIGRFISGIGGGGMTSLLTIAMSDLVPLRDRGLYQGITNCFFALGTMSGGYLGGLISDHFGWRMVFLLQVPLSLISVVLLVLYFKLPEGSQGLGVQGADIWTKLKKIDVLGSCLMVFSLAGIMLAASLGGRDIAYSSNTFIILLVISLAMLVAFAYVEIYIAEQPTIPVVLLADRTVLASSLANWFFCISVFAYSYYVPLYFTTVLALTSTQTGLRMVPNSIGVIGSLGSGYYMKKTGKYLMFHVVVGLLSVWGVFRICLMKDDISTFDQFTVSFVPTIGFSSVLTITLLLLISAVDVEHQASTTSIQYLFRSTGSTLGVAIGSSIFQNFLLKYLSYEVTSAGNSNGIETGLIQEVIDEALHNADYLNFGAPDWSYKAIKLSYDVSCHAVFWLSFVFIVMGYLSGCFMRENKLHTNFKRT